MVSLGSDSCPGSSSDLRSLETPTHIIITRNDSFFSQRCVPADDNSMSAKVTFELSIARGIVAFISGNLPFTGHDWLRDRITKLILQQSGKWTCFPFLSDTILTRLGIIRAKTPAGTFSRTRRPIEIAITLARRQANFRERFWDSVSQ